MQTTINRQALRDSLAGLSQTERLVLMLHYAERLSAAEIAIILELSEARVALTIDAVYRRIRRELADDLADKLADGRAGAAPAGE